MAVFFFMSTTLTATPVAPSLSSGLEFGRANWTAADHAAVGSLRRRQRRRWPDVQRLAFARDALDAGAQKPDTFLAGSGESRLCLGGREVYGRLGGFAG